MGNIMITILSDTDLTGPYKSLDSIGIHNIESLSNMQIAKCNSIFYMGKYGGKLLKNRDGERKTFKTWTDFTNEVTRQAISCGNSSGRTVNQLEVTHIQYLLEKVKEMEV